MIVLIWKKAEQIDKRISVEIGEREIVGALLLYFCSLCGKGGLSYIPYFHSLCVFKDSARERILTKDQKCVKKDKRYVSLRNKRTRLEKEIERQSREGEERI